MAELTNEQIQQIAAMPTELGLGLREIFSRYAYLGGGQPGALANPNVRQEIVNYIYANQGLLNVPNPASLSTFGSVSYENGMINYNLGGDVKVTAPNPAMPQTQPSLQIGAYTVQQQYQSEALEPQMRGSEFIPSITQTTVNPFTNQIISTAPNITSLNYQISQAYEKSTGLERFALNLQPLFSPVGLEYAWSFTPWSSRSPEDIVKEQMKASYITPNVVAPMTVGDYNLMNTWIGQQVLGSITDSPTGTLGTSLLLGYGTGAVAGSVIPKVGFLEGALAKMASHPTAVKTIGTGIIGAAESFKIYTMNQEGKPFEQIAGSVSKDIIGIYGFSAGFSVGLSEGLPFKFLGEKGHEASEFVNPDVLSGKTKYSERPFDYSAKELLTEFQSGNQKYTVDIGGWHTKTGDIAALTETRIGSSEHPGMFIAPDVNLAYTRIPGISSYIIPKNAPASSPAGAKALWIKTDVEISNAPASQISNFLIGKSGTPKAYVFSSEFPSIKPEAQAIIPPATTLVRTDAGTSFGGTDFIKLTRGIWTYKIPIMTYETVVGSVGISAADAASQFTPISSISSSISASANIGYIASSLASSGYSALSSIKPAAAAETASKMSSMTFEGPSLSEPITKLKSSSMTESFTTPISNIPSPSNNIPSLTNSAPSSSSLPPITSSGSSIQPPSSSIITSSSSSLISPVPSGSSSIQPSSPSKSISLSQNTPFPTPSHSFVPSYTPSKIFGMQNMGVGFNKTIKELMVPAYSAEIFTKGKWVKISEKPMSKGEAVRAGERAADKLSLAARFRVRPTGGMVEGSEEFAQPSSERFRGYKIVKGERVPLENEWIERSKFRLERKGQSKEVEEIKSEMSLRPANMLMITEKAPKVSYKSKQNDITSIQPISKPKKNYRTKSMANNVFKRMLGSGKVDFGFGQPNTKNVLPSGTGGNIVNMKKMKKRKFF